jgi:hypothetical protein
MNASQTATIIGITAKELRRYLREIRYPTSTSGRYNISHLEAYRLRRRYWEQYNDEYEDPTEWQGTPGLPIQWVGQENKRARFIAEMAARTERLHARLHEVGLEVPQMSDKTLEINARALSRALLG